jgi:hypothetical protein
MKERRAEPCSDGRAFSLDSHASHRSGSVAGGQHDSGRFIGNSDVDPFSTGMVIGPERARGYVRTVVGSLGISATAFRRRAIGRCRLHPYSKKKLRCCHSSAIARRRKGPDSPWSQSWLPSPRRGYGSGSETNGAQLQKQPRPRWSPAAPHRCRVRAYDGQGRL